MTAPRPSRITALEMLARGRPPAAAATFRDRHALPVVLDASAIIDDLLYRTGPRTTATSALTLAMFVGVVRAFGKLDVIEEVDRRLPALADTEHRDLTLMRHMLATDYVPRLRLVDVACLSFDHPGLRALAAEAPSDEPSAKLNLLLDPALLFATDKDLLRNGFGLWTDPVAPTAKWSHAAVATRDATALVTTTAGVFSAMMGMGLVGLLLGEAFTTHPRVAALMAGAAIGGLWAAAESPRWEAEWKPALGGKAKQAMASLGAYLERYPGAMAQLDAYKAAHPGPGTPVARLARTLALAPDSGLLISELRAIHPGVPDIRTVLASHRAFTPVGRWRWTLGTPALIPAA